MKLAETAKNKRKFEVEIKNKAMMFENAIYAFLIQKYKLNIFCYSKKPNLKIIRHVAIKCEKSNVLKFSFWRVFFMDTILCT